MNAIGYLCGVETLNEDRVKCSKRSQAIIFQHVLIGHIFTVVNTNVRLPPMSLKGIFIYTHHRNSV